MQKSNENEGSQSNKICDHDHMSDDRKKKIYLFHLKQLNLMVKHQTDSYKAPLQTMDELSIIFPCFASIFVKRCQMMISKLKSRNGEKSFSFDGLHWQ